MRLLVALTFFEFVISTAPIAGQSVIPRDDVHGFLKAKWGMKEEELLKAFGDEAKPFASPALPSEDRYIPLQIPSLTIGTSQFRVLFILDSKTKVLFAINVMPLSQPQSSQLTRSDGEVASVLKRLRSPRALTSPNDSVPFRDVKSMLIQTYGPPRASEDTGSMSSYTWEFQSTRIKLVWQDLNGLGMDGTKLSFTQMLAVPLAQSSDAKAPTTAITGKVFAITNEGDLKVARFAHVVVIGGVALIQFNRDHPVFEGSESNISYMRNIGANSRNFEAIARVTCLKQLHESLIGALGLKARYPSLVFTSETDEDGDFKIPAPVSTHSAILVYGKAGMNTAWWINDLTFPIEEPLKLRAPRTVCFDPNGSWQY